MSVDRALFEVMEHFIRKVVDIPSVSSQAEYIDREGGAIVRLLNRPHSDESGFILQDWVRNLGLRHQGVLVSAVRGPDSAPKEDHAKRVVRSYRAAILKCFCGDPKKASSFIETVDLTELRNRLDSLRRSFDQYPIHWVLHMLHAAEIVGYKHPDHDGIGMVWGRFYNLMCFKMHLNPESEADLDARLNASEDQFAARN